ncbi:xanthine dehydrogenase family protein molybdopterin-binding subunit [Pseudohalocynthiibacter sp. F2068]|jgi:aerobic carbon-monoxide dehydrogenase large subunit|uniref:xanthine dehydrogenase family protein molybdopterin-binding subunit n=1 Tax=Pseudohalocynthiibacter sp. F2068 TaxID=2926418 RepID=UPI001FF2CCC5|nr:xanthine dehydrogenase family protein molybdopterin-binding subunit [Pseudohalocynthiibacter sp. F2068]MCK0103358.1 xanthine dehydrogenase family protein molybdopterin-binding subunit [Pseudohalocynthiibacter sp. F2068]
MEKFGKSQPVKRVEDVRFLTGHGRYVDDITPEGALFAYVFRSPVAHADILLLGLEAARGSEGVHLVLDAAALEDAGVDISMAAMTVKNRDGSDGAAPMRPIMAKDRVRFVGEPIAMVIADTLDQARDAAELIEFDYKERPAHVALSVGGEELHSEAPNNLAFDWAKGDEEACDATFASAAHHVRFNVVDNRIIVSSMEPRGCFAEWDGKRLHLAVNGQGVWGQKKNLASALALEPEAVRVTNPDVGGAFGMKAMNYPEYAVVAQAARATGRPVRWMSDRSEAFQSDNSGRDLVSLCELAFDETHRITAYRVTTTCNLGAYNSQFAQPIQTELFSKVLMGTYDVQTAFMSVKGIYTNTTQVDAYRGAGRPEAIYALERTMDHAARVLGVDPWALRRKNFIKPEQFPYVSATGETYDVGDFHHVLGRSDQEADVGGFAKRKAESESRGMLRGIGLCYYIESILGDPSEGAKVSFNDDGTVSIFVGTQSNGQGHETVYAQFLSDQTGIPAKMIHVIQGDSDLIENGGGTGGSRSVTVQTNATLLTVEKMIAAFTPFVAEKLAVEEDTLGFDDTVFRTEASNQTPSLLDAVEWARAAGRDDLLVHESRATLPARSYPNGSHVAEVEIDPDTGGVRLERYSVVDDFGNLINPMLAEGQVHGGVAQGVGQALTEQVIYDQQGQLLSASFMDYAMPRADDLPMIGFATEAVPSTANAMGMKGCGEAGTVGAIAAVANAVQDALWAKGVHQADMPFTPHRVWKMLNESNDADT